TGQACALQYTRFTCGSPAFVSPDDVVMTGGNTTGAFPNAPVAIPNPSEANLGASQLYVDAYKNGKQLNGNSALGSVDFTITGSNFLPTVAGVATDIFE